FLWLLNIIREGIPYFYTIQKSFMHLHKIFYALVTFVERKTRLLWAIKAPNRTAKTLNDTFGKFMGTCGSQVKSITVDHGKEFADYRSIEQDYQIKVYFC
ncbi:DDE-type integrase/transposase/recombinase, partial [Secundilactobacillus angelensis]|uniref:DDE-type integrase/transposase/recombinase n=1 Tax=Secundilactobacillus angelensis TaxID=2722706 RepID=UPI002FCDD61F